MSFKRNGKVSDKHLQTNKSHSPAEHKSSGLPPDYEEKEYCSTARIDRLNPEDPAGQWPPAESDQVRYMRGHLCGRVSVLKCLWLLVDIQQQVISKEPSRRVGAWGRRRHELKWQFKDRIWALSLNLNHRLLLQPKLVSEPHPVSVLGSTSTPWHLCLRLACFINGSVEDGVRQLQAWADWLHCWLMQNSEHWG